MTGRVISLPASSNRNRHLHVVDGAADKATDARGRRERPDHLALVRGGGGDTLITKWMHYQQRRGLMPSTIAKRTDMVRLFAEWLDRDLLDATQEDIEAFVFGRHGVGGRALTDRTRYTWLSCLGCFYGWAVRSGYLDDDPTKRIERPKLRLPLPRPISDEDLAHALAHADPQMRRWLLLGAYGGLRCAEIAGLHRDDLLLDIGMMRIVGKGNKERLVPMHELVIEALATWPMPRSTVPIFTRPDGTAWTPAQVSATGAKFFRSHGIDATMHQLRHWFGTRTLRACKDIRVVQELMGHASPTTTAIYTAFCNEDGRAAVAQLPAAVARPERPGRPVDVEAAAA